MIRIRKSAERGHADHGWLQSWHTFSFADYYDPRHLGFRVLRVINEDRVAAQSGFPLHPHRDMEILTVVVAGELEHTDSLGHREIIGAGQVQRITAGRGIQHSEANPSPATEVHLLQIWIEPRHTGLAPGYETVRPPRSPDGARLLASPDGRGGSARLEQDALLYEFALAPAARADYPLVAGRGAWLQVVSGGVTVNGVPLLQGDGAAIEDLAVLELQAGGAGVHALLFDLP